MTWQLWCLVVFGGLVFASSVWDEVNLYRAADATLRIDKKLRK